MGEGLHLSGDGGLLQQLTKWVLGSALESEITDHLGYERHDLAGCGNGNKRNGDMWPAASSCSWSRSASDG